MVVAFDKSSSLTRCVSLNNSIAASFSRLSCDFCSMTDYTGKLLFSSIKASQLLCLLLFVVLILHTNSFFFPSCYCYNHSYQSQNALGQFLQHQVSFLCTFPYHTEEA